MSEFVVSLDVVRQSDAARVGRKAAVPGTLRDAGFPVPAGLCVTTAAFHLALKAHRSQIDVILGAHDLGDAAGAHAAAGRIATLLADLSVPPAVATALRESLPAVASGHAALAIRSSATAEDRAEASFAGQYTTVLGTCGCDAVLAAVVTCWRSFFSPNALIARARQGAAQDGEAMAVLVQRAVAAECAGVCFTVDPVRHRRDLIVSTRRGG